MWRFYYARHTISLATHIALEEAGADFEAIRVDFRTTEQQSRDYLAVNPKGRVPSLVTEGGVLTETPALLLFVAQSFPEADLAPEDPWELARMQEFDSYVCSTLHVSHAHGMRGYRWVDADDERSQQAMRDKVSRNMADAFGHVESRYLDGPNVLGDRYSVADAYLYTVAQWLERDGLSFDDFPKVRDHHAMMSERPAVRRALETQFAD